MAKNLLSKDEVKNIIRDSLPPEMSLQEKENFLDNLFLPDAGSTQQPNSQPAPTQPSA